MVEIWVPYGPVEVSFDIRQENLSQILEPGAKKLTREEIDQKIADTFGSTSILLLSSTNATSQVLDSILSKNKEIVKLYYSRETASLAKKKAQEFQVPSIEEINTEKLLDVESVDSSEGRMFTQIKESSNLTLLTSVRYDPLFGLTSAASDLISLSSEMKGEAFMRSIDELPCSPKSNSSWFATRLLQTCPNVSTIEVVERTSVGPLGIYIGEPEAVHAKVIEFWNSNLSINIPSKAERVIFGSGGGRNDRTLTEALARGFFNVVENIALKSSQAKICMLAECSEGLGAEALLRYVTGRFIPGAKLDDLTYFDGLEVLLSFYKVQENLDLSMISTLPKFYGEKFQFKMYSGAREAPSSLISSGSRAKISVIPDASSSVFSLAGAIS